MEAADRRVVIAAARTGFLTSGSAVEGAVPDVVVASWQRSRTAGVDATASQATFHTDLDMSSRLVRCSRPIIDRLSEETADIPLSIALTDGKARVLTRVDTARTIGLMLDNVSFAPGFEYAERGIGTNGVGTVFESGQPVQIVGPEHFHECLQPFACSGAPVRDPLSGRIEGVLDISCLTEHSNPLMHSLVRSAVHEIERNLLIDRSHSQQALFETFVRTDARSRDAVMALGGSVTMANAFAHVLLTPGEQQTVHDHARHLMSRQDRAVDQLELNTGKVVRVRGTRITAGHDVVGIVVEVALIAEGTAPGPGSPVAEEAVRTPRMGTGANLSLSQLLTPSTLSGSGRSPLWRRACGDIASALSRHEALLVMGETGTGKFSLVAEIYHRVNPRGRSLLIDAVDISRSSYADADAETALEATALPTLYIFRNIDQLSTDGVERLNTFLLALADSDRPVYVAATLSDANIDSDLPFHDLLVHFQQAVTVPPLRHRSEDIPAVVAQVLNKISGKRDTRVSPAALRVICRYTWPHNIRQLEEALTATLLRRPVGEIQPEDLPGYCHDAARRRLTGMEAIERDAIIKALHDANGNRVQAAAILGIARSSLYRKLKSFGVTTI
ncbi:sigma-54-dependent Fis family transcriptional regulator [Streptomyces sp. GC420]|uniref:sigma-54-dependent Fis family transcriptional regulator n=1 Tax=Streptomyces sp. GC420 TaxID=2697568 RepID=UPI001414EA81|nr:helix-turn-helix domain-containing protein [Streptomyces sp. GC420]NBM14438.1 transcriptional regulator [Streptomyces sp. GC420]